MNDWGVVGAQILLPLSCNSIKLIRDQRHHRGIFGVDFHVEAKLRCVSLVTNKPLAKTVLMISSMNQRFLLDLRTVMMIANMQFVTDLDPSTPKCKQNSCHKESCKTLPLPCRYITICMKFYSRGRQSSQAIRST